MARSGYWDTRRRKGEPTGETNFGLNRRASPRPYRKGCSSGCTVYEHRPSACRSFDCRAFAAIGLVEYCDPNHRIPDWEFTEDEH